MLGDNSVMSVCIKRLKTARLNIHRAFLALFIYTACNAMRNAPIKQLLHHFSVHIIAPIMAVAADTDMDLNCHLSSQENHEQL